MHPFAAGCPTCGADLDAARRQRVARRGRPTIALSSLRTEVIDIVIPALVLLVLALYAPLFGALFSLLVVWHSHHHGLIARRNVAIVCAALAIFDLLAPGVILPALTI